MSKCGICGNELLTGDIHWAIGICNDCYNKHYKSDEQKYVDVLHKETGELLVNSLTEKDKQIIELQKQLKKHNEYFNTFGCNNFDEFTDFISTFMLIPHEEQTLIKVLKNKLKSQPKEIMEKIKKELEINGNDYCEIRRVNSPHTNHQYAWFNYVRFRDYLDAISKEYDN